MSFVSWQFVIFFPVVLVTYYLTPVRHRWMLLLPASLVFFLALNVWHGLLLGWVIFVSYLFALFIDDQKREKGRVALLAVGLLATLSLLAYYKYSAFTVNSVSRVFGLAGVELGWTMEQLILPLGISFFTLQAVGYLFDVYRGSIQAERNFARYALFISFFPQLVAGPIERAKNILPQLRMPHPYDYDEFKFGLKLFAWGLFKKVVVADNMANIVDPIYNSPQDFSGPVLLIGTIAFAFQIYCDFSGYTDMAIGIGRMLGIRLMKNFNIPYFARTIPEFWERWHISLSTWFRDYLYIPLGGNRTTLFRWCINILIVFAVSGLWHGANWTFVIWGFLHAFYYLMTRWLFGPLAHIRKALGLASDSWLVTVLQVLLTFSLVTLAWVFFRANGVHDAFYILNHMFTGWPSFTVEGLKSVAHQVNVTYVFTAFGALAILLVAEFMHSVNIGVEWVQRRHAVIRWGLYYALAGVILLFGDFGHSKFIYFQF